MTDYALNLTLRDTNPERLDELPAIFERGVTSIKMFIAYEGYVTAAGSAIGRTIGPGFARQGARVVCADTGACASATAG